MRLSSAILVICIVFSTLMLVGLGTWQLQRLEWKEGMIARVDAGLTHDPVSIGEIESLQAAGKDIEYRPAFASGTFVHDAESHFFATHQGQVGYFVYTPMRLEGGRLLMVNRGFVPIHLKDEKDRAEGLIAGKQQVVGLARSAPAEKPNGFVPENDIEKNVFHWKSLDQMIANLPDETGGEIVRVFLDAGDTPVPGGWPKGGVTRISFPNNHLQYAVTWFGLALALVVVGVMFLRSRAGRAV